MELYFVLSFNCRPVLHILLFPPKNRLWWPPSLNLQVVVKSHTMKEIKKNEVVDGTVILNRIERYVRQRNWYRHCLFSAHHISVRCIWGWVLHTARRWDGIDRWDEWGCDIEQNGIRVTLWVAIGSEPTPESSKPGFSMPEAIVSPANQKWYLTASHYIPVVKA